MSRTTENIGFNVPYLTGNETEYIKDAVASSKISGDGKYTHKCHAYFEENFNIQKALLTTSCTDALEMAAILINIQPGDEIIAPSFTFVSTVNAFVLRGAKIVFADSYSNNPNIDVNKIESLITDKTKAIIPVHYAGVSCDMDKIMQLAKEYNLYVIEDAAQAIDSYYLNSQGEKIPLGTIGDLGTFSFHETKNIISGEGGLLAINDRSFSDRAEIIREKGTNRSKFFRGEVDKYGWVDIGSSFLPSDIIAAFLFAQLENLEDIQSKRLQIWNQYFNGLGHLQKNGSIELPLVPDYATNNAHMFYLVCNSEIERTNLINHLRANGIHAVFHYQSLHKSEFYKDKYNGVDLPNADKFTSRLLRLPMYYELRHEQVQHVIDSINKFFE